jgi:hypothetical protein
MAISINHDMDQGANFSFALVARDVNGNAIDLSAGCTAYCQMRKHYNSSNYTALNASLTGGTGYITISMGPTGTAAIKAGTYFYDVELHSNAGQTIQRLLQGMITVYPEVTRI